MHGSYIRYIMQSRVGMPGALRDRQKRIERQELHAITPTASGGPLSSAQPYDVWPTDSNYWPPFPFPTFDDTTLQPEGWELIQVHFINFDKDGAPIQTTGKTIKEFIAEIREGHGYAFLNVGTIAEYQLIKTG